MEKHLSYKLDRLINIHVVSNYSDISQKYMINITRSLKSSYGSKRIDEAYLKNDSILMP
jgi:hypothetical protein